MTRRSVTPLQGFMTKVVIRDAAGCWLWTAGKSAGGHGVYRSRSAHRWIYEVMNGPVDAGLVMDHLCRNRACVNPWHVEPVTPGENIRRGDTGAVHRNKTVCKNGHPFAGENTYLRPDGGRNCRACARVVDRQRRPPKQR